MRHFRINPQLESVWECCAWVPESFCGFPCLDCRFCGCWRATITTISFCCLLACLERSCLSRCWNILRNKRRFKATRKDWIWIMVREGPVAGGSVALQPARSSVFLLWPFLTMEKSKLLSSFIKETLWGSNFLPLKRSLVMVSVNVRKKDKETEMTCFTQIHFI